MIKASTKNAPGLNEKIAIGSKSSFVMLMPKIAPAPRNSLITPIAVSPTVNPRPIPRPSKRDGITGFFEA